MHECRRVTVCDVHTITDDSHGSLWRALTAAGTDRETRLNKDRVCLEREYISTQERRKWNKEVKTMSSRMSADREADSMDLDEIFNRIKKKDFTQEAELFKALGHPIRLKIVYGLMQVGGCNVKNMQECLGLHQATVSQHLIHLKSRGVIESTRQGLEMIYRVTNPLAERIVEVLESEDEDS